MNTLNALDIGRNDRVAVVVPNGLEMASAFLTLACGVTVAPLNPACRANEFDLYLSDLNAKALKVGPKAECLAYVGEVWTDMRPLSLSKKMETGTNKR